MNFTVYMAIDVRAGRVVRLRQGDYACETRYDDEPAALAERYAAAKAQWLHLVDLDAAREGGYRLKPLLQHIKRCTRLRVQTGGGIRDADDVADALAAGADRIVIGSTAVLHPERVAAWLTRFGRERIAVALDMRRDSAGVARVPAQGWTVSSEQTFDALLAFYRDAGLLHLLCTAIERDGTLAGPDLVLYSQIRRAAPDICVQVSGGIRNVGDIRDAYATGSAGVVLGKALLEERMTIAEALAW